MLAFRVKAAQDSVLASVLAIGLGACGGGNSSLPSYGPGHAKVTLHSERKTLTPGTETLLALTFDLEPGWHLYWKGQNDTGFPPRLSLELPPGFRAGDLRWPVPERLVSPGGILDHVYKTRGTLLLPLAVPADVVPGQSYEIRGEASWLACHDICVPGRAHVSLALTAQASEASPPEDPVGARLVAEAKASLPLPWEDVQGRITSFWENGTLLLRSPGASRLSFFPDTACVAIVDLLHTGEVAGEAMRLAPQESAPDGEISGILGIETPADTLYFLLREPLPRQP